MKRKTLQFAAIAVVAGLALAGCSSSGSTTSSKKVSGTIVVWARDYTKPVMQPIVNAYNATHKAQVKLTLVPSATYVQKIGTAVSAGSGPDVLVSDLVFDPYFASVGAIKDITKQAEALPYFKSLSPAHLAQAKYKGKYYALPFRADVSVLYWNKTLFKQAGLDPSVGPKNFAEFEADAKAVTKLGGGKYGYTFSGSCGGCNIFSLTPFIWASGGNVLSADGSKAQLDSPDVTAALQVYRNLWTAGAIPPVDQTDNGSGAAQPFLDGDAAMRVDGTGFLNSLVTASNKVDFGVEAVPGIHGGSASFAGGENISEASGAKNPAGAWDFLKFATGAQAQTLLANQAILPIRLDIVNKVFTSQDPRYAVFVHALKVGKVPYSTVENELFNDNNGVWAKLISTAVFDGNIKQAQATAQKAAQAILDAAKK